MIVNKNASLKKLNTFNVDASCDVLVESSNTNDILEVLNNKELNINLFILGGGSNILFTKHYQGTIINLKEESIKILDEGPDKVQVEVFETIKSPMLLDVNEAEKAVLYK